MKQYGWRYARWPLGKDLARVARQRSRAIIREERMELLTKEERRANLESALQAMGL